MRLLLFIALSIFYLSSLIGQIAITETVLNDVYAPGNAQNLFRNGLTQSVDIGQPGGGNIFDFSGFSLVQVGSWSSIDPEDSPYASSYPEADLCLHLVETQNPYQFEVFDYFSMDEGMDLDARIAELTLQTNPTDILETNYTPASRQFQFPTLYGSQWSSVSQTEDGVQQFEYSVDAYGLLLLPGGISEEVLRIRMTHTIDDDVVNVFYRYWSNSGVNLWAELSSDNESAVEGEVAVTDLFYADAMIPLSTSVWETSEESNYDIYPNPATHQLKLSVEDHTGKTISFQLSDATRGVVMRKTWIDSAALSKEQVIDVSVLARGVYYATISTDESVDSQKIIIH